MLGCNDTGNNEQFESNNTGNKQLTENKIAEKTVKVGRRCKESNVHDVFVSSLVDTAQKQ